MADEWFYVRDGQQVGPMSSVELKRLAGVGDVAPTDMVSKKGLGRWLPASSIRGLFAKHTQSVHEGASFVDGDVTITLATLTIGPNQFDLRNVQAVDVSPVVDGTPYGAIVAFCMACYSFCAGALSGPALFLGGLFVLVNTLDLKMGFSLLLCSLASTSASYAIGRLLLRPARNLWIPKSGEYQLSVKTSNGSHACVAGTDLPALEGLAKKINERLGHPSRPVFRTAEPRWIRFIRTRVPFIFRD